MNAAESYKNTVVSACQSQQGAVNPHVLDVEPYPPQPQLLLYTVEADSWTTPSQFEPVDDNENIRQFILWTDGQGNGSLREYGYTPRT